MPIDIKEKPMFPGDKLGDFTAKKKGIILIGENKASGKGTAIFVAEDEGEDGLIIGREEIFKALE